MWRRKLDPARVDEYIEAHADVWPEVLSDIKAAGVRNYSIFLDGDEVLGYFEYDDDQRRPGVPSEAMQRWDARMRPLGASDDEGGAVSITRQVFYLD
jgi:L-rhamnose mutarotase